jgi:hypothetical protein
MIKCNIKAKKQNEQKTVLGRFFLAQLLKSQKKVLLAVLVGLCQKLAFGNGR